MVGQAAADLVEVVEALARGGLQGLPVGDLGARDLRELVAVVGEARGADVHEAVGAEGRQDLEAVVGLLGGEELVVGEVARRVVGRADALHVHALDEALGGEVRRGQKRVGALPDLLGVLAADGEVDAKEAAELQVAPVVDRVADGALDSVDEGQVLGVVVVAADHGLGRAVRAHEAPLVVVAEAVVVEPDLGEVLVALVLVDLSGNEVAVVVDDRHLLRVAVVELARPLGVQQEVVAQKHATRRPSRCRRPCPGPPRRR